jgi:hypothetical protein
VTDKKEDAFSRQIKIQTGKTIEELKKEIATVFKGAYVLIKRIPQ